jgi:hypothetical protein
VVGHIPLEKYLNVSYNISLDLTSIGGVYTKLWAPKVAEVPSLEILRFPLGNFGTK